MKKLIVLLLLPLCLAAQNILPGILTAQSSTAISPISIVGHAAAANPTTTTASINTAGATLLVLAIASFGQTSVGNFTDSAGNTWYGYSGSGGSAADLSFTQSGSAISIYLCFSPITSSSHSVTFTGSSFFQWMDFVAFSGIAVSYQGAYSGSSTYLAGQVVLYSSATYISLQNSNSNNIPSSSPTWWREIAASDGASANSLAAGAITPTNNGMLILSAMMTQAVGQTYSVGASLSIIDSVPGSTGASGITGGALGWYQQPTAGAINPTWAFSGSAAAMAVVTLFL